jgi:hypothetical protein
MSISGCSLATVAIRERMVRIVKDGSAAVRTASPNPVHGVSEYGTKTSGIVSLRGPAFLESATTPTMRTHGSPATLTNAGRVNRDSRTSRPTGSSDPLNRSRCIV